MQGLYFYDPDDYYNRFDKNFGPLKYWAIGWLNKKLNLLYKTRMAFRWKRIYLSAGIAIPNWSFIIIIIQYLDINIKF